MTKKEGQDERVDLARFLERRVDALRTLIRRALRSWDVEAVHDARVATRRLKAAADLLGPLVSPGPKDEFIRALRQARRTLGPVRDIDVMLMHLDTMRVPPAATDAAAWVVRQLHEERAKLRRKAARGPTARKFLDRLGAWDDLEPEVREANATAGLLLKRAVPGQLRDFTERADRLARRPSGDDTADAPAESHDEDAHQLRIAGKLLRYTLELAEPLGCRVPGPVLKDFKKLQDMLGLWHDFAVLTDTILEMASDEQLAVARPHAFDGILRLAGASWAQARQHLDRFAKRWATRGPAITAAVTKLFGEEPAAAEPGSNGHEPAPEEAAVERVANTTSEIA